MKGYASLLAFLVLAVEPAWAEVSARAAQLGGDLTSLGAERAGSPDGTIPAWAGGLASPPPGWEPGTWHEDPYPEDEVRFHISAANLEAHEAHLSEGQKGLLRAYPDTWRMPVYPTRRTAAFPDWVVEAVKENAARAEVSLEGKGGVRKARVSSPFPIPSQGVEVVWNHNLRWRGVRVSRPQGLAAVTRGGRYSVVRSLQEFGFPYGARTANAFRRAHPNVLLALKTKVIAPALLSGDGTLLIEPIDQTREPRRTWAYRRALRQVLRLPHFAYDFPAPQSEGLQFVDELDVFSGPPNKFDWKLLGKRALYIPYNAYRLHGDRATPKAVLRIGHIAPEVTRYELHRVWVVEGTLREGEQHAYSRRVLYVDEDSWQVAVADAYDSDGKLWRVAEQHALQFYDVPVLWSTFQVFHDLAQRRYFAAGFDDGFRPPRWSDGGDPRVFSPNALLYFVR
ncbi:MAG: DUF1329 domain-containing protein [Myxococcota bacterium]|nr:DUF1329 domain-containing protein [Myxococcota bacterium]